MSELKNLLESAGMSKDVTNRVQSIHESEVSAAVDKRMDEAVKQMQEAAETRFTARLNESRTEMATMLAESLNQALQEWYAENSEALVEGARQEMALAAIATINEAFSVLALTNDTELKESVEAMRKQVDLKESEIKSLQEKLTAINEAEDARVKANMLTEATVGMTDVAADRIKRLAEGMGHATPEQYKVRLADIKETIQALTEAVAVAKPANPEAAAKPLNEGAGAGVDAAKPGEGDGGTAVNENTDIARALRFAQTGRFE